MYNLRFVYVRMFIEACNAPGKDGFQWPILRRNVPITELSIHRRAREHSTNRTRGEFGRSTVSKELFKSRKIEQNRPCTGGSASSDRSLRKEQFVASRRPLLERGRFHRCRVILDGIPVNEENHSLNLAETGAHGIETRIRRS